MRAHASGVNVLMCAAVLSGCAGTPPRAPPTESTTPIPHAKLVAAPNAPTTDAALDAKLVREGYRIDRRGEQVRYCRTQVATGTAFSSTVCLTPQQIQEQRRSLQQSQDTLVQPRGITCAGKLCSGG